MRRLTVDPVVALTYVNLSYATVDVVERMILLHLEFRIKHEHMYYYGGGASS